MRLKRPTAPILVAAALLILLPTLALLQYRWVGQVREADRERMQTHVRSAAVQFREALDGEIARAVINLQVGTTTARDGFSDRYSDRYDAWMATAAHPQMVANVLLVDAVDASLQLRRWNQTSHAFEPFAWPDKLRPWVALFEEQLAASRNGRPFDRRIAAALDESYLLSPLRPPPPNLGDTPPQAEATLGFSILELDLGYIRTQLLADLAQRYFPLSGSDGYRVAVTRADDPNDVIFRSDADAPLDLARADASEPLFGVRSDFLFFGRGGGGRVPDGRRILQFRGFDGNGGRSGGRGADREQGRWVLLAQHQSGSLDAAVTRTRNRNLGIGFGILLLLSVSVGMLAVTSGRAQRLAQQQMEFVAGVSHELRTPIAVIRTAADNLSEGVVGSPDRVKRYGQAIGGEARRLGEMVENVIQYAGLESGRDLAAYAPLDVGTLVDDAIAQAMPVITSAGVTVERRTDDDLPRVAGDAVALRSALHNLIANAVKYGGEDRWIRVKAERAGEGKHLAVRFVVEDHGGGIPARDLPHIFEPFYRGSEAVERQVHGNGLGLSIVKRIVTAHRGRISVTTQPGAGTTFTIVLPASTIQADASVAAIAPDAEAHS